MCGSVATDPGTRAAYLLRVSDADRYPGDAQHGDGREEHAAFYRLPPALLVILEVEGQLGPRIAAFDAGAAVEQGLIPEAASSQDAERIGGQASS